jgi:hypothetical protein
MPHQAKKQKIDGHLRRSDAVVAVGDEFAASFDGLSVDVLANILGFLQLKDIMCKRRLNKKTLEAVKKTIVPPTDFRVSGMNEYNAMVVMTRAMPNLQQIKLTVFGYKLTLTTLGNRHKYNDGEDPDERQASQTADWTSHDIEIISNFSKLRILEIDAFMNGRYPFLFNSFPLLQKLSITGCKYLKWDLEMLGGLPLLKELDCHTNCGLTGNLKSLRVLKDTLEKVTIEYCGHVRATLWIWPTFHT